MTDALQISPYGNIYKLGPAPDGRTLYDVIDSGGKKAGRLSVRNEDTDTFERAYDNILDSASKIRQYTLENSTENDKKQRKRLSRGIITACGAIGAIIPLLLTGKNSSLPKRVIALVVGIVTGLSAGFIASFAATLPPETFRFIKAERQVSKLDIKNYEQ